MVTEDHLRGNRPGEVSQVRSQVDQKIIDGDHPHELPASNHPETPDAMSTEQGEGIVKVSVSVDSHHRRGHHSVDPGIERIVPGQGPPNQIAIGHDSDEAVTVHNTQSPNAGMIHNRGSIMNSPFR